MLKESLAETELVIETDAQGNEISFKHRPPTSRELWALRRLNELESVVNGLVNSYTTLEGQFNELMQQHAALRDEYDKIKRESEIAKSATPNNEVPA